MSEAEWGAEASTLRARHGMPAWSLRDTHAADLRAMYRFIRSLGPSDKPSRPPLPPGEEPQTLYIRVIAAPKPPAPPADVSPSVATAEMLARGRYMLVTGHCNNCHTATYELLDGKVPS